LRILYSFPDTLGAPGIGTTAHNHAAGLIGRGHDVTVYCTSLARPLAGARSIVTTLSVAGARIPHRAVGRRRAYRHHDRRVSAALRGLGREVDVVHCWPRGTLVTAAAAEQLSVPSVRELPNAHTAYAYEVVALELASLGLEPVAGHSHTLDPAALALEEAEFRAVDLLAAPSEFVVHTFLERGFEPSRLGLHQYGFDPARFPPGADAPRGGDGLAVVFISRCEPRKGLHYALQAWRESGAAERGRFLVCGDFFPGYREAISGLLDHPSVEVRGFTPDPGAVMRESDLLVLPSIEEGSALVTYEAQASGCVLLVSDAAGARCEHMRHGLVHEARDVAALTEHFALLDRDRDLLGRLRRQTLAHRPELTWERAAEALEGLYARLLEQHRPTAENP
jgi:glycosyltransferase involved in cell wall biosynthesis